MSREIKLKYIWSNPTKTHFLSKIFTLDEIESGEQFMVLDNEPFFKNYRRVAILQWTGLLDKNDKEVYEGDIIRIKPNPKDYGGYKGHNYIELVFWNDEEACYDIAIDRTWLLLKSDIEIIGNIYENPELMGGKNV